MKSRSRPWIRMVFVITILFLYLPLWVLVICSFLERGNFLFLTETALDGSTNAWTLKWYRELWEDTGFLLALRTSLEVGLWSALGSVVLGVAGALSLERFRVPGRRFFEVLVMLPLVTPEIVLGIALLVWFVFLRISLGKVSLVLAHVTFCVSYVIMTVRARLSDLDPLLEEAARDLGASGWQVFQRVTFPLIKPAVLTGGILAFTLSFDDFIVSFFVTGVGVETLPLRLWSQIRFGLSPKVHAASTVLMVATFVLVGAVFLGGLGSKMKGAGSAKV